jgi:hypothetical protein
VEPENRLVARELERAWQQALIDEQKVNEERSRFQSEWSGGISEQDRNAIRALSSDIPALWASPTTTNQDRQMIVRHLIDQVVVTVQGDSEFVDVTIHWAGGFLSQHQILRPVGRYEQLRDCDRLLLRVGELRAAGHTHGEIAALLNDEGFHTPKCDQKFDAPLVYRLASRCGLVHTLSSNRDHAWKKHEWSMSGLAREVGVPYSTLRNWCYHGWVHTCHGAPKGKCRTVWADEQEIGRLQRLRDHPHPAPNIPYPAELTTPRTPQEQ